MNTDLKIGAKALEAATTFIQASYILGPNEGNILRGKPGEQYILVATNLVGDVPANVYATNFQVEWLFYNVVIDPNQLKEGDPAPFTMGEAGVVQIFNTTESTNGRPLVSFRLKKA